MTSKDSDANGARDGRATLSPDVEAFVREFVDTAVELEILLCLGTAGDSLFTSSAIARTVHVPVFSASSALHRLATVGCLEISEVGKTTAFRVRPEMVGRLGRLVQASVRHPGELERFVQDIEAERARATTVETFGGVLGHAGKKPSGK